MRYLYNHIRVTEIKFKDKLTVLRTGKDEKQPELSNMAGGNTKWYSYFGK